MTPAIEPISPPLQVDESGAIRVGKTRVTLDSVIGAFLDGASAETIAESYPALSLADIYATISYYLTHRVQLDEYLQTRHVEAEALRIEIESRPEYKLWRERLLERARARGLRE